MAPEQFREIIQRLESKEINSLYVVTCGSVLYSNDVTFVVVVRDKDALVVSEEDALSARFGAVLARDLNATKRLYRAFAAKPPWPWRARLWGLLPCLSVRSGQYPLRDFELAKLTWRIMRTENVDEVMDVFP